MNKEELFIKAVNECLAIMGAYDMEYIKVLYRSSLIADGYINVWEY